LALTADVEAAMERLGNVGVHLNVELLLRRQLFIAQLDGVLHPAFEGLAEDRVGDVEQPLARQTRQVAVFRQVVVDEGVLLGGLEDPFDGDVLILGTVEELDRFAFDTTEE